MLTVTPAKFSPALRLIDKGVAALPFVWLVAPVERVRRSPDPAGSEIPLARLAPARETGRAALDHGLMQRPLDQIGVPSVHGAGFTGKGVLVTVLDDGFNFFDKHEADVVETVKEYVSNMMSKPREGR